jgi:predicted O-linked N-acetylglucosamine transferase (SPINDLY family)
MADNEMTALALKQQAFACIQAQQFHEAKALYTEICRADGQDAEAWFLLGAVNAQLGLFDESIACCHQAVAFRPDYVDAYYNIAQVHMHRGNFKEAVAAYRQVVRLSPDHALALNNLGYALHELGDDPEAVASHRQALALRPDDVDTLNNLGNALYSMHKLAEAEAYYRRALQINPDYVKAYQGLGALFMTQGLTESAERAFRKVLELKPDDAKAYHGLLTAMNYHSSDPIQVFQAHKAWGELQPRPGLQEISYANVRDPDRRLRVGYVSPNLRVHSVAYFFEPLLASHDPAVVETCCYADVRRPDAVTERLRKTAGVWRDVHGMADEQVVDLIRKDGIDILVDLAGHTANNRLAVFTHHPAPIQVTYLGYPNTTGLPAMDYRLTDAWADPSGETDAWHTEKLVRLSCGLLCYQPYSDAPPVGALPVATNGFIRFGSFNHIAKINAEVIAVWAGIIRAIPESRLVLKHGLLKEGAMAERCYALFAEHGVARERLELHNRAPSVREHLHFYGDIDVALDTFPYNGTTTTCEALWMGVPVITLAGRRHAGRVGVSLLSRVGLTELIADTKDQYHALAVRLATDRNRLADLHSTLRERVAQSSLCDSKAFARQVERAYREMWLKWCASDPSM